VIRIHLPALRERREDIPALLRLFLQRATEQLGMGPKKLLPEVEQYLSTLDWPGNVRQLENTCHWLAVMTSGQSIHLSDLPGDLQSGGLSPAQPASANWQESLQKQVEQVLASGKANLIADLIPQVETILIKAALKQTRGRKNDASKLLGWGRNTLTRKIKELELED
jgi:two-component system nitrogen regulation response regulator GlnG